MVDIAFVSLCKKIFLLLFDIVNLHFATFTNYLYCLLKIKVLDYCLVAFGHKKMQFCPTLTITIFCWSVLVSLQIFLENIVYFFVSFPFYEFVWSSCCGHDWSCACGVIAGILWYVPKKVEISTYSILLVGSATILG